jgi:raffinose/stachyose/melibiose transport system substrate-binding protein
VVKGASDALTNPLLRDVQNMVAHAPYFQLYYDQYFPPAIANAVLDGTQALYAGTTTPQAVAQQVQAAAATALQGS